MASEIDARSDARETAASTSQSNFKHESGQCSLLAAHYLLLTADRGLDAPHARYLTVLEFVGSLEILGNAEDDASGGET